MSGDRDVVLCINCGSSSLKVALFVARGAKGTPSSAGATKGPELHALAIGTVSAIGSERAKASLRLLGSDEPGSGRPRANEEVRPHTEITRDLPRSDHRAALDAILALLRAGDVSVPLPTIVGHRVVHGGERYVDPVPITPDVVTALEALVPLAPLHMPPAIAAIEAVTRSMPGVPQVACFDTAFHATMPEVARRLPIPSRFDAKGVRRYGFHGLSYEHVVATVRPLPARVVIAHLGNGASLVAVRDGKAVDTTMGFTPTGGIVMGTRTGDLDPGAIVYLLRSEGLGVDDLEKVVDRESGLLALGGTSDMKTLVARSKGTLAEGEGGSCTRDEAAAARLALDAFARSVRKAIAALTTSMEGIDLLVFTGGIGEHAAEVRAAICEGLAFMGITLDRARNDAHGRLGPGGALRHGHDAERGLISAEASTCAVLVVPTDEDRVIAGHARDVVHAARS